MRKKIESKNVSWNFCLSFLWKKFYARLGKVGLKKCAIQSWSDAVRSKIISCPSWEVEGRSATAARARYECSISGRTRIITRSLKFTTLRPIKPCTRRYWQLGSFSHDTRIFLWEIAKPKFTLRKNTKRDSGGCTKLIFYSDGKTCIHLVSWNCAILRGFSYCRDSRTPYHSTDGREKSAKFLETKPAVTIRWGFSRLFPKLRPEFRFFGCRGESSFNL